MDKLQRWFERIQRAPQREVANLDYWDLLLETRIAQESVGAFRPPAAPSEVERESRQLIGHPLAPS